MAWLHEDLDDLQSIEEGLVGGEQGLSSTRKTVSFLSRARSWFTRSAPKESPAQSDVSDSGSCCFVVQSLPDTAVGSRTMIAMAKQTLRRAARLSRDWQMFSVAVWGTRRRSCPKLTMRTTANSVRLDRRSQLRKPETIVRITPRSGLSARELRSESCAMIVTAGSTRPQNQLMTNGV